MDFEDVNDLLKNPYGLYEKMRQDFLKKCQDGSVGNIAIELYEYLCKTEEYGKIHDMQYDITEKNINVVRYFIWSMPRELRKKLLKIDENQPNEDLLQEMCYIISEHEGSHERKKLLTSRQFVYNGIANNEDVTRPLSIFRAKVKKFLERFKQGISKVERNFWLEKLTITSKAVKPYQMKTGQEGVVN